MKTLACAVTILVTGNGAAHAAKATDTKATAVSGSISDQATDESKRSPDDAIVVTADRRGSFGADYVQAGTFRDSVLRETPLTVSVFTKELLEAQQASSVIDAVRNTPGVTQSQINASIYSNLSIRGIPVNNFANVRWNGILPVINLIEQPIESTDRIEVLKGAAGLYYGFAAPSGVINLVSERPVRALLRGEAQADDHGSFGLNIDAARRFGIAGLRVNAGASSLETGVDRTSGRRTFATGAFDLDPIPGVELLFDAEHIFKTISEPTEFSLTPVAGKITLPPLLSPAKNLGGEWMQARGRETNLLARLNVELGRGWRLATAVGQSYLTRNRNYSSFGNYDLATGNGTVMVAMTAGNDYKNVIYRGDLSGTVTTGLIDHDLMIGVAYGTRDSNVPTSVRRSFSQNLYRPVEIPEQPTPPRIIANPSRVEDLGLYIFDRAKVGDWLQLTLGYRKTDYSDVSLTSSYKIKPDTFSYGAMIKPVSWANLYANYIEGLEPGPIAQQIAINAGETLPAAVSKQKEAGIKLEPQHGLLLTAAYFHITRPSAYLNSDRFFVQDGLALYEGGEFGINGELTPRLSIAGGATLLKATQESGAALVVGKRIENVARFSGSMFVEYRVPQVDGLRVSGGVFHVGGRAVNALNQAFVPGYTTLDLGASYRFKLARANTTLRLYAQNVTGKRYWAATGSSLLQQGLPPSIRLSLLTDF